MSDYANTKLGFYIEGARRSRTNSAQWFRYLRKAIGDDPYALSVPDMEGILNSGALTMYQTVTFKRVMEVGTPTHMYVDGLNQRAKTPMID